MSRTDRILPKRIIDLVAVTKSDKAGASEATTEFRRESSPWKHPFRTSGQAEMTLQRVSLS